MSVNDENDPSQSVPSRRKHDDALRLGPRKKPFGFRLLLLHSLMQYLDARAILSYITAVTLVEQYMRCAVYTRSSPMALFEMANGLMTRMTPSPPSKELVLTRISPSAN